MHVCTTIGGGCRSKIIKKLRNEFQSPADAECHFMEMERAAAGTCIIILMMHSTSPLYTVLFTQSHELHTLQISPPGPAALSYLDCSPLTDLPSLDHHHPLTVLPSLDHHPLTVLPSLDCHSLTVLPSLDQICPFSTIHLAIPVSAKVPCLILMHLQGGKEERQRDCLDESFRQL